MTFQVPSSFQPYLDTFFNQPDNLPEGSWAILWEIDLIVQGTNEMIEELPSQNADFHASFKKSIDYNKNRVAELIVTYLQKYSNQHRPEQYTFPPAMKPWIVLYNGNLFDRSYALYQSLNDIIVRSEDLIDLHHSLAILEVDAEYASQSFNKESLTVWIESVQEKLDAEISDFLAQYHNC